MTPDHDTASSPTGPSPEGAPRARAPRAFAIAVAVVTLMLVGASAIGISVLFGGRHEPAPPVAAGGSMKLASMPPATAVHYRFAAAHTHVYEHVPCFCGCEATLDHRSLLECFVRPEGGWERHASGCAVCLDESQMIRSMLARGSPMGEMRSEIVAAYTMDA